MIALCACHVLPRKNCFASICTSKHVTCQSCKFAERNDNFRNLKLFWILVLVFVMSTVSITVLGRVQILQRHNSARQHDRA